MSIPHLPRATPDLAQQNVERLRALFPEAVTEGPHGLTVDFDRLRARLSPCIAEGPAERYRLEWPGKREAMLEAARPTSAALRPVRERSLDFDATQNLYIEGDNLEALKLLSKAYQGKVKMIYIDPPYNTGHDFVYRDNYAREKREELLRSGKLSEEGYRQIDRESATENSEANGRFHSDWLSMMYPRLLLAKDFLTDDGVLFISIDDHEVANLRKLCDEIFGEQNFVGDIVWNSTKSVTNTALISVAHTYNLIYFRNSAYFVSHRYEFRLPDDGVGFSNPDNDPRGPWKADPFQVGGWRPNQQYAITNPTTGEVFHPNPGCSWKNDHTRFKQLIADNRIVFGRTGAGGPLRKRFLSEALERGKVAKTWWDDIETTSNGTQYLKTLFEGIGLFDNPKPISLLHRCLELGASSDSLVLDFFSGSGTTADAVMRLNAEDGGKRRFILVQLPEATAEGSEARKAGFGTLCDIGEERIRRAGAKLLEARPELRGKLDVGFRVLKVDAPNLRQVAQTPAEAAQGLRLEEETVVEGRGEEDLLFQAILMAGSLPLTCALTRREVAGVTVWEAEGGALAACLAKEGVTAAVAEAMAQGQPAMAVFLEAGFGGDDTAKANVQERFLRLSPGTALRFL